MRAHRCRTENLRETKWQLLNTLVVMLSWFCIKPVNNDVFASMGGVKTKHNRYDCYNRIVGATTIEINANKVWLPVTRKIEYKTRSLHKCDARCQNSTGHVCSVLVAENIME